MKFAFSLEKDTLTAEEFCALQESVGYGRSDEAQMRLALQRTLHTVKAIVDGKTVGMGRATGDGYRFAMLNDVFIHPSYQGCGIGRAIVESLLQTLQEQVLPGTKLMVNLMAAKGKEGFYEKFCFAARPNDHQGCGMGRMLGK